VSLQSLAYGFPYGNIGSYSTGSRTVDGVFPFRRILFPRIPRISFSFHYFPFFFSQYRGEMEIEYFPTGGISEDQESGFYTDT